MLIGFIGVLFILVLYMIEGGLLKNYNFIKVMMYRDEVIWFVLMNYLVDVFVKYVIV